MNRSFKQVCMGLSGALALSTPVLGRDLFRVGISVDGAAAVTRGVNDIRDFADIFGNVSLRDIVGTYTQNSTVVTSVDLRGISATVSYAANSTELHLAAPAAGLDLRFPGLSRDESEQLLKDWLLGKAEVAGLATRSDLERLLRAAVDLSPVEPMAGNPNSLQSQMISADWNRAVFGPRVRVSGPETDKPESVFHLEADYGGYRAEGFDVNTVNLSFGGMINFPNRHWAFLMDGPVMMSWTEGSQSWMTHPGVGVQYRINDWWDLTGMGRAGLVGSYKVGSLGGIYGSTLTSYMHHDFGKITGGFAIMSGFSHSIDDVKISDYNITYGLKNYPLKTGLDVSGPLGFKMGSKEAAWSVYGNYTHMFGTDLFLEDIYEGGVGFHLVKDENGTRWNWMRVHVGYVYGDGYKGVNTGVSFDF